MEKSKVYFTKEITPENIVKMYDALGIKLPGKVAVKLHSGEQGNQNYLKPEFVKPMIEHVNGTVVECNTAYGGARNSTEKHVELMKEHGWSKYFDVDILDAEGPDLEIEIPNGKQIKKDYLGKDIKKYDSMYTEMIKENTLLIDTTGAKVGQINGLTIMNIGDYMFGKPVKITATTYTGKNGVINIEREVDLSGSTHSKGVYILSGYLGEKFAQDIPLSLTASICFEQLYNGVDGDSASSTELYAILSSLSGVPINQSFAVTGSVNQKGEIQPIGGVNEKIEGFFQICKMRGLDGTHGVMIPVQNVNNLQLSDEVVEAVKNKEFHIYAISSIDEGIEVLTGVPAGKKDKDGKFPAGTVNYLVYEKLKKYAKICDK